MESTISVKPKHHPSVGSHDAVWNPISGTQANNGWERHPKGGTLCHITYAHRPEDVGEGLVEDQGLEAIAVRALVSGERWGGCHSLQWVQDVGPEPHQSFSERKAFPLPGGGVDRIGETEGDRIRQPPGHSTLRGSRTHRGPLWGEGNGKGGAVAARRSGRLTVMPQFYVICWVLVGNPCTHLPPPPLHLPRLPLNGGLDNELSYDRGSGTA